MITTALESEAPRSQERNLRDTGRSLTVWATCSILLILVYALAFWREGLGRMLSIFSHGTLFAVAFGSLGSLVGFLFGIPRTLQSGSNAIGTSSTFGAQDSKDGDNYHQEVNTNLEQISDWLTKILVGVGLTQLQNIPSKLMRLAAYFQPGIGGCQSRMKIPHFAGRKFPTPEAYKAASLASDAVEPSAVLGRVWGLTVPEAKELDAARSCSRAGTSPALRRSFNR
jgi:hypothetical protein